MNIPPGSPQIRTQVPARPDALPQQRPAADAAPPRTRPADDAVAAAGRPGTVAAGHRIERPIPAEAPRPAPRGSFINLLV